MAGSTHPAKPGEKARAKRADEVRQEQIDNKMEGFTNVPVEPVETVKASTVTGREKGEPIHIEAVGGELIIDTHGVARLGREAAVGLAKRVSRAVGAIS